MRPTKEWTDEELAYLRANYLNETCEDSAGRFHCSAPTISNKIRSMGLRKPKANTSFVWSDWQVDYVREHFPYEAAVDIADVIGVSSTLIRKKALEMGLKKSPDYDRKKYFHRYIKDYKNNIRKVFVA